MKLEYKNKNVIDTLGNYVNAQCISEDCAMGSGVVVAYNKAMPNLKKSCLKYMDNPDRNEKGLIKPYKYTCSNGTIYNMYTKEKYWHNAYKGMTHNNYICRLRYSLEEVRNDMIKNNLNKLAIPKIGSGRDRLDWSEVEGLLFEIFGTTDIEILVCVYKG